VTRGGGERAVPSAGAQAVSYGCVARARSRCVIFSITLGCMNGALIVEPTTTGDVRVLIEMTATGGQGRLRAGGTASARGWLPRDTVKVRLTSSALRSLPNAPHGR
jgi:hypothetical protein